MAVCADKEGIVIFGNEKDNIFVMIEEEIVGHVDTVFDGGAGDQDAGRTDLFLQRMAG